MTKVEDAARDVPLERPETGKHLHHIGMALTALWLVLLWVYCMFNWPSIRSLEPNEVGDALAGGFAPLAFFWLVLGFLQQGAELRNSGHALWLQGEELRNSVEQQRQLVEVTREQLSFESDRLSAESERIRRLAQPSLALVISGFSTRPSGTRVQNIDLVNHGRPCTRVDLQAEGGAKRRSWDHIGTGKREQFSVLIPPDFNRDEIEVKYLDEHGEPGIVRFEITQPNAGQMRITSLFD